jgi:hypothetical protein
MVEESPRKPGYRTSEFWLTVATAVAKAVLPDLPDEAVWTVIAYILSRGTVKTADVISKKK